MAISFNNAPTGKDFISTISRAVDKNGDEISKNKVLKTGRNPEEPMEIVNKSYMDSLEDWLYYRTPVFTKRDDTGKVVWTETMLHNIKPIILTENTNYCGFYLSKPDPVFTFDCSTFLTDYTPYYRRIRFNLYIEDTFVGCYDYAHPRSSIYEGQLYIKDEDGNILGSEILKGGWTDYQSFSILRVGGREYELHLNTELCVKATIPPEYTLQGKKLYLYINNFLYRGAEDSSYYYSYPNAEKHVRFSLDSIKEECEQKSKTSFYK